MKYFLILWKEYDITFQKNCEKPKKRNLKRIRISNRNRQIKGLRIWNNNLQIKGNGNACVAMHISWGSLARKWKRMESIFIVKDVMLYMFQELDLIWYWKGDSKGKQYLVC